VTQAAYLGPWLWKLAVEKAGSFDIDKIAAASPGIEFKEAPEGYVRSSTTEPSPLEQAPHRPVAADGQAKVLYESGLIEPDPFPEGLSMMVSA
jgi:urea transport system substrate-binding protein